MKTLGIYWQFLASNKYSVVKLSKLININFELNYDFKKQNR